MEAHSTLITHSGAERITRAELANLPIPAGTKTFKPVHHADLVNTIEEELDARKLTIVKQEYAVMRDGSMLFATLDLSYMKSKETTAALGLRTANDRSMSIQLVAGLRIFLCDNMAMSGDIIALRRKHTSGLDLPMEIRGAIDRYQGGVKQLMSGVENLKTADVSDNRAKRIIFDAFYEDIMPMRYFDKVSDDYFLAKERNDEQLEPRTMWSLHNAFTRHIKELSPARAFAANTQLGQLFKLTASEN